MLKKINRLKKNKDFEIVHRTGKFLSFGRVSVKFISEKDKEMPAKIGVSVGIKFSKKAVERNRVKRQLREIVRLNLKRIKKGFQIVVMVKSSEKQISGVELKKDLLEALRRAGLLIN
jgi:ribonuclease P protein component